MRQRPSLCCMPGSLSLAQAGGRTASGKQTRSALRAGEYRPGRRAPARNRKRVCETAQPPARAVPTLARGTSAPAQAVPKKSLIASTTRTS
jgi:hypothetical protein